MVEEGLEQALRRTSRARPRRRTAPRRARRCRSGPARRHRRRPPRPARSAAPYRGQLRPDAEALGRSATLPASSASVAPVGRRRGDELRAADARSARTAMPAAPGPRPAAGRHGRRRRSASRPSRSRHPRYVPQAARAVQVGSGRHGREQVDLDRVLDPLAAAPPCSFCRARCSIWRTRSLLMPSRTPSSSSVRPSSRRRRSRMMVRSRSLSSASDERQPARALLAVVGAGDDLLRARAARRPGSPARRPRRSG